MGFNLGGDDYQGCCGGNYMQNMFQNPGLEPSTDGHLIDVGPGATSSSFTDTTDNGAATNYWVGAIASVRSGAAAGDQFTVTGYTADGSYTFGSCENATGAPISCPTLTTGVAVGEVLTSVDVAGNMDTNVIGGWGGVHDGHCVLSIADKYEGQGSIACNVADGSAHTFNYGWDLSTTTGGVCSNDNVTPCTVANQTADCGGGNTCLTAPQAGPWHPVVGAFETSFWAKGANTSTGTPQVSFQLYRTAGGGVNVSHTWTLTNDGAWHQYTYSFTGTDVGPNQNSLLYQFSTTNNSAETSATIYIDDAYLGKAASSATGFRNEMLTTVNALNPGSMRYAAYAQLGTNDRGYEGAQGCNPTPSSPTTTGTCDMLHGAAFDTYGGAPNGSWTFAGSDVYALANQTNSVPFMTLGNVMSDADLKSFIDNLCTAVNTYSFPSAWVEGGNENWNNGAGRISFGNNPGALGYGGTWGRNFSVMNTEATAHCGSAVAAKIHYIMNNQACNGGVIQTEIAGAATAGFAIPNTNQYGGDDAPYYPNTTSMPFATGSLAAQAATFAADFFGYIPQYVNNGNGCTGGASNGDYSYVQSNNVIPFYEEGPNAYSSSGGSTTEQGYLAQAGYPSAAWMVQSWLWGQQQGRTPLQNEYQLAQPEFGGSISVPIWGFTHDMDADFGPTFPHLRSIGIGMEIVNGAIQANYYPITGLPSGVVANAYGSNGLGTGNMSAVLVNGNGTAQSFAVVFPAGSTVPQSCVASVYTNGLADNNENSDDVTAGACTSVTTVGQAVGITLRPYQVAAMDAGTPGPTATATATATNTATATATATATGGATATATATATSTATATATSTATATATTSPTPTAAPTATACAGLPPTTVTITGNLYDNYGNPSVGTTVAVTPLNPTAQGCSLIMANPVPTSTDKFGHFTLNAVGGIYSAVSFAGGVDLPTTLILTTLPQTGVVTLSQLLAQQSNIVTSFPPNGNLNMNGFTFLNLAGATIAGNPVVEGLGLSGGAVFTSSGTFTVPLNSTYIVATLFAGGGGGGGGHSGTNGGGGGGGGQILQCLMLPVNGTITVTIGAGGTAGTASPSAGGNAVDTIASQSSATTICDAGGGSGGAAGSGGSPGAGGAGGAASATITGAAIQMFVTNGTVGANGTSSAGGTGAGLGLFGGTGGAPAGAGVAGAKGVALLRAF
jgi:hypothetical protein